MGGESFAAPPRAVGSAELEREQRIPVLRQGNGGAVRVSIDAKEMGKLKNLFKGISKLSFLQILFCGIVLTLGILSAVMGGFAEYYSYKEKEIIEHEHKCVYPGNLVITFCTHAAMFLVAAQVLTNVFGCTVCYSGNGRSNDERVVSNSPAYAKGSLAITYLLASWIFCLIALYYFSVADMTRESNKSSDKCTVVKVLVFVKGSVFALAAVVYGLIFYLAQCAAKAIADAKLELSQDQSLV